MGLRSLATANDTALRSLLFVDNQDNVEKSTPDTTDDASNDPIQFFERDQSQQVKEHNSLNMIKISNVRHESDEDNGRKSYNQKIKTKEKSNTENVLMMDQNVSID